MTKRQLTGSALCAKAIRAELKEKFSKVKFSVRSENFSMGNAVRIEWTDGVAENEVTKITDKYEYGHFNAMEDIYEMSNCRDDIPQVKYITTYRKKSEIIKDDKIMTFSVNSKRTNHVWTGSYWQAI